MPKKPSAHKQAQTDSFALYPFTLTRKLAGTLKLEDLLSDVKNGALPIEAAAEKLRALPYENLGFARVDHHREVRQGMAEVIFCQGKQPEQVARIAKSLYDAGENVLASRATQEDFDAVRALLPDAVFHREARTMEVRRHTVAQKGCVAVVTAGTADIPVAEEAAVTAEACGCGVTRVFDVGVAGIHRLFDRLPQLQAADCAIVVAGMDGALPSVVGGLVGCPCVAVPTSVGYGASFGGLAALLTMLNSCSAGVAVMNIDNGFGAGVFAAKLIRRLYTEAPAGEAAEHTGD